ncbi:hypothetical protein B7R22_12615 [Subtercola boreus]|uniref:DUF559 domain-containing protein n=1 Tax=Subtercola boreus TaxID=120213 RepID=A0A3E0VXF0_9MICO|nr:hypothetical protein B7R22_12615 [Subtercola boreus]
MAITRPAGRRLGLAGLLHRRRDSASSPQTDRTSGRAASQTRTLDAMYSDPGVQRYATQAVRHISQLRREGFTRREVERAIESGALRRIRRGWYAAQDAHPDVVAAVRVGGSLTGPSAAVLYGLWVPPDVRLHVSVSHNASRLRATEEGHPSACIHWRRSPDSVLNVVESLPSALRDAVGCVPEEMAVVLVDSALNLAIGDLTLHDLRRKFAGQGEKYARVLDRSDGGSQSGLETLVRLRLRSHGIAVRTQVRHRGVGAVDLLVGDRLVIELDGREHHDNADGFVSDRRRDLVLFSGGIERLRLTYHHVMHQWPETERVILDFVRRRRHHWRSGDRPADHLFRHARPGGTI